MDRTWNILKLCSKLSERVGLKIGGKGKTVFCRPIPSSFQTASPVGIYGVVHMKNTQRSGKCSHIQCDGKTHASEKGQMGERERERETFTSYLRKKKKAVPLGLKKM